MGPARAAHARVGPLGRVQQLVGADAERGGEPGQMVEREPALARLQAAERRDVHPRARGDRFERQAALRSQLAEPPAHMRID